MKVLVLGSRIPYPMHDGGAKASYQLLQILNGLNHELTFFSFNTKKHFASAQILKEKFSFCRVITHDLDGSIKPYHAIRSLIAGKSYNLSRFSSASANNALEKLLEEETFDVIHFESLFTIPFLKVVQKNHKGPLLLRQHNAENKIWDKLAKSSKGLKKGYISVLARQLRKEEEMVLSKFNAIIGISQKDTDYFQRFNKNASFISVAQEQHIPIPAIKPHTLCHIGSMEWQPNVQAVEWFLDVIWDEILRLNPKAEFHIAGKSLDKMDPRFKKPNVINHGEVSDSNEFLRNNGLLVIPLQSASGVRMKALEAMSHGIPIVSTQIGVSGLAVEHGKEVWLGDSPEEMIQGVQLLLNGSEEALRMGKNGWDYVNQNFSVQALSQKWSALYSEIANQ
ncbi:glycosyltransferase family 4 protein [Bacteroidia bacterium]|nr:glycosyltransferase family 4 protein [Bacteroidia bacterium]